MYDEDGTPHVAAGVSGPLVVHAQGSDTSFVSSVDSIEFPRPANRAADVARLFPPSVVDDIRKGTLIKPAAADLLERWMAPLPAPTTPDPVADLPIGPMKARECPGGISSGTPDYFSGEPVHDQPEARAADLAKHTVLNRFPDARQAVVGHASETLEIA